MNYIKKHVLVWEKHILVLPAKQAEPLRMKFCWKKCTYCRNRAACQRPCTPPYSQWLQPSGDEPAVSPWLWKTSFAKSCWVLSDMTRLQLHLQQSELYWSGSNGDASPEFSFSHWYVAVGRLKGGNMLPSADPVVGIGISNCYSRIQSSHSSVPFVSA